MRWLRKPSGEPLAVSMSSIKLGDRLLVVGCSDASLITTLAIKSGLTGRTCIVDESESLTSRTAAAVEREGALIESFTAPYESLPFAVDAFDVVLVRNVFPAIGTERATRLAAEVRRILRAGGRGIVIDGESRSGLAGLLKGASPESSRTEETLTGAGFRGVRTLAAREGLTFVEGVKPGA